MSRAGMLKRNRQTLKLKEETLSKSHTSKNYGMSASTASNNELFE
jgi:hypothetical protein